MKLIRLHGDSSFARGLALGQRIRDICAVNFSFIGETLSATNLDVEQAFALAVQNERMLAKHFPELLEEIRGLAEGAQVPYEFMLLETAFPFAAGSRPHCTVVCVHKPVTRAGATIVGRNYDFLPNLQECNQLRIVHRTSGECSFAGGTVTMLGVEEGLNSAGLFVGDAGVEPTQLPGARGLSSRQVMQLVLEQCTTVDGAIDLVREVPKFANNAGTCYLIADKRDAVVIEQGLTTSCLRGQEDGGLVAGNLFLSWLANEMKPPEPAAHTRHAHVNQQLHENRGNFDIKQMQRLLSDHRGSVCGHDDISTLRCLIAKIGEAKVRVADGPPCCSGFRRVSIPA